MQRPSYRKFYIRNIGQKL